MAYETHKQKEPTPEYDQAVQVYRQFQAGAASRADPDPALDQAGLKKSEEWYMAAAEGDIILGGLYKSVADNETDLEEVQAGGVEVQRFQKILDGYELARQGLNEAIASRRQELLDKKELDREP